MLDRERAPLGGVEPDLLDLQQVFVAEAG